MSETGGNEPPDDGNSTISEEQFSAIRLPRDTTRAVKVASFELGKARHHVKTAGLAVQAFAKKRGLDKPTFVEAFADDLDNAILLGLPPAERKAFRYQLSGRANKNDSPELAEMRRLRSLACEHVRDVKRRILRYAFPPESLPDDGDKPTNSKSGDKGNNSATASNKPDKKAKKKTAAKADKDSEEVEEAEEVGEECEDEYEDDSDDGTSVASSIGSIMSGRSSAGSTSSAGSKRPRRSSTASSVSSMDVDSEDDDDSISLQNAKANLEKTAPKWILLDQQKKLKELYQLASPFIALSAEWASRYGVGSLQPEDARTMSALADWLMLNIDDKGNLNTEDDLKQSSASGKAVSFEV